MEKMAILTVYQGSQQLRGRTFFANIFIFLKIFIFFISSLKMEKVLGYGSMSFKILKMLLINTFSVFVTGFSASASTITEKTK